jgi:hypothetical protein
LAFLHRSKMQVGRTFLSNIAKIQDGWELNHARVYFGFHEAGRYCLIRRSRIAGWDRLSSVSNVTVRRPSRYLQFVEDVKTTSLKKKTKRSYLSH